MASQFDLAPRLAALQDRGLTVESEYRGTPPQWLTAALAGGLDVRVINCKGAKPNDVLCMVRLSRLEELLAAANVKANGEPVGVGA